MSRRTATNANHNSSSPTKRVRFDATSAPASPGDSTTSVNNTPLFIADSFIKNHVASLQPQLASILGKLGHQHVSLLHKLYNKQAQITRMEGDEDFIPRSARIDFQFHMSNRAEERPEFLALQEETNSHIADFRKFLRQQIIKATKIEGDTLVEEIKLGFLKALRLTIEAFLIGDDIGIAADNNMLHAIISSLMDNRHDTLLRHTSFSSFEEFCDTYKRFHNLSIFPVDGQSTGSGGSSTIATSPFFNRHPNNQTPVRDHSTIGPVSLLQLDKIARVLESVFIIPFDEYLKQLKKHQISLHLKKLSTTHFTEESTARSQMQLDREPSADREQLQSLIKKQTQAETKSLVKELNKLQEKIKNIESKKSSRGPRATPGASQKQVRIPSKQKQSTGNGNVKADESDNASKKGRERRNNQKDGNSTKKKSTKSKTKKGN
jgi:hypothetical protein